MHFNSLSVGKSGNTFTKYFINTIILNYEEFKSK